MIFQVHVIEDAEQDLIEIHDFVVRSGSPMNAEKLLTRLEEAITSLDQVPERGHLPPELKRLGIFDYREIHVKVYRIIYQVIGSDVFVHCVLDGRRDLQDLLRQRLIR